MATGSAQAETLATLPARSPLATDSGYGVWSTYDAAANQWRLTALTPGGAVAPLPVAPSPAAFPVALGAGPDGHELALYARCSHPLTDPVNGPPADRASGCALERFDFATLHAGALRVTAPQGDAIYAPALSGDRIAFAYVRPGERRPRLAVAPLDASGPATEVARGPLRFCAQRTFGPGRHQVCSPAKNVAVGGLGVDGERLAFSWSYSGYNDGGPSYRSDLMVEDTGAGGGSRLVAQATGDDNVRPDYGVVWLQGARLTAILRCVQGPACAVQPPVVERLSTGTTRRVAQARLSFTPFAAALDGDVALLLAAPAVGGFEPFGDCGTGGCVLSGAQLTSFSTIPPLPAARSCGIVRSGKVLLSLTSAGRTCASAGALIRRVFAIIIRRGYARDGALTCVRLGQTGLVPQPRETLVACRRPGVSVHGAYAGGLPTGRGLGTSGFSGA